MNRLDRSPFDSYGIVIGADGSLSCGRGSAAEVCVGVAVVAERVPFGVADGAEPANADS